MNETKKVNEISSKKNFGKYSKKVHRRSDKAITLIALIVTIIVLLILVGVTINLALNNQGIFNKAKTATRAFKNAEEGEQSGLDVADREIAKYMPQGTSEGGNGSESSGGASEAGQVYIQENGDVGFYAQSDGKLYSFNCTAGTYYDKDFDLTYIRDDIKKYYGDEDYGGKYITNTNELYKYNYDSKQYEKIGDNVKELEENYYLTNTNELYQYNYDSKQYEKVGENVKKYYGDAAYLTNTNELYQYNFSSKKYEKVGDNVKELVGNAYITNTNELYQYNFSSNQYEKVGENVKEYDSDRDAYLTNSNELYKYNYDSKQYEKVGDNVKEYYDFGNAYITNTNELYKYNYDSKQYEKVGDNVKELEENYYITNSDEIYAYNDDYYEKIEVNVDDIKEFGKDYFITKNNKIRVRIPGLR